MSDKNPYQELGVKENASFDEIQEAKKRLSEQNKDNSKAVQNIEAAYDAIIMDRLKMRQEGKIKVPERIRFPDKEYETPQNVTSTPTNNSPGWLQQFIDTPSQADIVITAGVFILLSSIAIFYPDKAQLPPLLVALGFSFNIYFLNRKEQRFGRAILLTLVGLLVGIGLGSVIADVLNSQSGGGINFGSQQFASIFTFFLFWLISSFLR